MTQSDCREEEDEKLPATGPALKNIVAALESGV